MNETRRSGGEARSRLHPTDREFEFLDHERHSVRYLRRPFERSGITTDFNGASVDFPFADLLARAEAPR